MNEIKLYINNQWQTFEVLNGDTYSWRADDTLDSGTLLFVSSDKMPIAPFTLAQVNFQGIETVYMWACDDKVTVYTKGTSPTYQHTIVLGELTKILEKLEVQGFVSSDNGYANLNEELVRFVDNYNSIYADKIKLLHNSPSLITKLQNSAPENFTMKSSTVREILDEMFSAINSRVEVTACYVNASTGEYTLQIGAFDLNAISSGAIADADIMGIESENSADNLAGRLVSEVENAQSPNAIRVVDTMKFKYGEGMVNSQNRIISLPYAIEYPIEFYLIYQGEIQLDMLFQSGSTSERITADRDISGVNMNALDRFVDSEYYDTLANQTIKNGYLAYQRYSTEIDVSGTYKALFITRSNLETVLKEVVKKWVTDNKTALEAEYSQRLGGTVTIYPDSTIIYGTFSADKIYYDLTYQARIDGMVMAFKNTDQRYGNQLAIYDNQSDSVIDIERYGGNLAGKIRRTGNDELFIDCNYQSYSSIQPLLSEITLDGTKYVIYQVDFSRFYNGENYNYLVRYYLAKDFNNLNERIGIRRQKRIYEIPLTGYRTILPRVHTISISKTSASGTNTDIVDEFVDTLARPQAERWRKRKIENAKVVVDDFTGGMNKTFTLPAIAYGAGQTVNLITKFYDNYSAGLSVSNTHSIIDWVGGKKVLYNPYVYNNGKAYDFDVSFGSFATRSAQGIEKQPAQPTTPETLSTVVNDYFDYQKDSAESLTFQEIINIKADGVILGKALTGVNTMTVDAPPDLKIWATTESDKYQQGDTKCRGAIVTGGITAITQSVRTQIQVSFSGTKHNIALGDADGNLYVAVNGNFNGQMQFYLTEI